MNTATNGIVADPVMRILKIGTCPSLSGLSEITYQVCCPMDAEDVSSICFRITGNSSSGKYNPNAISIAAIERALANIPPEQTFTAAAFNTLYIGGSSNSSGFMGSILLAAGLIARAPDSRAYIRNTAAEFFEEMQTLISASVNLTPTSMPHTSGHSSSGSGVVEAKAKKKKPVTTTA